MSSLQNKTALVTGSSRGLGRETALKLAKEGANLIICYRKEKESADQVVKDIEEMGLKATALQVDLNGTKGLSLFITQVKDWLAGQGLDILVHNAGIEQKGTLDQFTEDSFDMIFNTNVKAPFFLTQGLNSVMNKNGRIIMIGTGLTRFSIDPYIGYAASKSALSTLATYLAKTLSPRGITVNTVAPGALKTDFTKDFYAANPDVVDFITRSTALGRIGMPEDIVGLIAFLCSKESGWVTGQRIEASGGIFL